MVAFSARRLVWLAISVISLTTSPIAAASLQRPCIVALVRSASITAFCAMLVDCATWRPISVTELASSSDAAATVCTLAEASSVAAATAVAWLDVSSAVAVMAEAVACSSVDAEATVLSTAEMPASKPSVSSFTRAARAIRSLMASASLAASSLALIMFSLKTTTARAISPISSCFSVAGISAA